MGGTLSRLALLRTVRALLVVGAVALASGVTGAQDKPAAKTPRAVLTLAKGGEIVLEFFPQDAPRHVQNFIALAKKGFYDGQRVHRVEPAFVVQFGDPQTKTLPLDDDRVGSGGPGYTTIDPPPADARYTQGRRGDGKDAGGAGGDCRQPVLRRHRRRRGPPARLRDPRESHRRARRRRGDRPARGPGEQPTEEVEIEKATVRG